MATTTTELIPYCGPNDAPDVPYWMQRLAERVDALLTPLRTLVNANALGARGLMLEMKTTGTSGAFTGLTIIHNIPTFTFKAGRRYEIIWDGSIQSTQGGDIADLQITTCSVTDSASIITGLTVLRQKSFNCVTADRINAHQVKAVVTFAADTTKQLKFVAQRGTGGGLITQVASTNVHTLYQIHDVGAQAVQIA